MRVLLTLDESTYLPGEFAMGADHPIAWQHEFDGGRAWYTEGGHTDESYSEPLFLGHLLGGIQWALPDAPRSRAAEDDGGGPAEIQVSCRSPLRGRRSWARRRSSCPRCSVSSCPRADDPAAPG